MKQGASILLLRFAVFTLVGLLALFSFSTGVFAVAPPKVTSITPASGPTAGGTNVTIGGTGFAAGTITIGGTLATNFVLVNDTTITATTPVGMAGARNVVFTRTSDGKSGTLTGGFTYVAPTPTPTEEPPIVKTIPVGGGGNVPARIIFSGKAFPGATMGVYLISKEYGQVLINGEFKTEDDGSFEKEIISPVEEKRFYAILIKDRDGNSAKSKFFTYNLKYNTVVRQENLIFAPTIEVNKAAFIKNELLLVSGDAAPAGKVELLIDGKVFSEVQTLADGQYQIIVNTDKIVLGIHTLKTRQVDTQSGEISDVSEAKIIKISSFSFSNIDFNQDSQINISDWSIFLSNWSSPDQNTSTKADLNGNGKLDVSDFSVFLTSFQLSYGR